MRSTIHTAFDGLVRVENEEIADFPKTIGFKVGAGGSPAPKVHLVYAPAGARIHLRKYHPVSRKLAGAFIEAENRLLASGVSPAEFPEKYDGPRCAIFCVWKSLKTVSNSTIGLSAIPEGGLC